MIHEKNHLCLFRYHWHQYPWGYETHISWFGWLSVTQYLLPKLQRSDIPLSARVKPGSFFIYTYHIHYSWPATPDDVTLGCLRCMSVYYNKNNVCAKKHNVISKMLKFKCQWFPFLFPYLESIDVSNGRQIQLCLSELGYVEDLILHS